MKKFSLKVFYLLFLKILSVTFCLAQNKTLSINIAANDIIYDSTRQLIYATIKSEDSYNFGNRVVAINPATGKVMKNVFVGSQPMRMALTTGNAYLYVSLGGSPRIIRVRLDNFEVDMDFLTSDYRQVEFEYAQDDIAVFPNKTDYVISTLSSAINQGELDWGYGVSVLQNGKQINASTNRTSVWGDAIVDLEKNVIGIPAGVYMSSLAVDSNIIVATEGYGAMIMTRTIYNEFVPQYYYKGQSPIYSAGSSNARIAIDKNIIFTSAGKVVRLLPNYQLEEITTLPNASSPHRPFSFFIDKANNSVYYANTEGVNVKIKKFNKTTYALDADYMKAAVLPNSNVTPRRFIKLGGNQAALILQNNDRLNTTLYRIIILNLDNNTDAIVNIDRESKSATERTGTITSLTIAAEEIVFDSLRQRYYANVKRTDPIHPKSIIAIDAKTLTVIDKKIILPEAAFSPLILSRDNKYLYFQQYFSHTILRLDLDTWTITGSHDMGVNPHVDEGRRFVLTDGASLSDPTTNLALVIGDEYIRGGNPEIRVFDTAFNLVKAYQGFGAAVIESATNGKTIFFQHIGT
jgi:hypothetical protein